VYSEIADLVGVTDAIPEQARKIGERLDVMSFENADELLDKVDAVSICTPTLFHFDTR